MDPVERVRQLRKALLQVPRAQELEEATLVLRGCLVPREQPQPLLAPPALDLAPTLHRHPLRRPEPRSSPQPKLQLLLERDRIVVLAVLGAEDQGDVASLGSRDQFLERARTLLELLCVTLLELVPFLRIAQTIS